MLKCLVEMKLAIFVSVPDSALLYAAPSTAHTETVLVRNAGRAAATDVYISYRDRVGKDEDVRSRY